MFCLELLHGALVVDKKMCLEYMQMFQKHFALLILLQNVNMATNIKSTMIILRSAMIGLTKKFKGMSSEFRNSFKDFKNFLLAERLKMKFQFLFFYSIQL